MREIGKVYFIFCILVGINFDLVSFIGNNLWCLIYVRFFCKENDYILYIFSYF